MMSGYGEMHDVSRIRENRQAVCRKILRFCVGILGDRGWEDGIQDGMTNQRNILPRKCESGKKMIKKMVVSTTFYG